VLFRLLKLCCADFESWSQTYAVQYTDLACCFYFQSSVELLQRDHVFSGNSPQRTFHLPGSYCFTAAWQTIYWNSIVHFTCVVANLCVGIISSEELCSLCNSLQRIFHLPEPQRVLHLLEANALGCLGLWSHSLGAPMVQ
jgi:hypothetical protein